MIMSRIEEMAEVYGKDRPFVWYDNNGEIYENISKPAIAYSDGANAVLKEIEDVLYSPITPYQLYYDLDKLVKELKGE